MSLPQPAEHPPGRLAQLRRLPAGALTFWRRSLRTRVVTAIVVLCAVVVGSVGWLVMRQISDGLVKSRVDASVAEARTETATARERLGSAGGNDFDPDTQLRLLVENLVARGEVKGFEVVVLGPVDEGSTVGGVRTTPTVDASSVPGSVAQVRREGRERPGLDLHPDHATRSPATTAPPARSPASRSAPRSCCRPTAGATRSTTCSRCRRSSRPSCCCGRCCYLAGALLLLLVAGVALLVTRQVITPVRLARRVAERIASGRLEERMHVSGEDDIARLAMSFNQMAEALQSQIRQLVELSRVQRRFVSDVSHELRTPLTTVRMAGDVLHDARGSFDPMTARSAELLQKELDRFEHLLADLLEISRFDAGAAVLDLEDANLADVVHRVVAATAPMALQRGVTVTDPRPGRVHGRGRRTPGGADRAQPRGQRDRPRRLRRGLDPSGDGRPGDRPHRPRPRSRAAARTVRDGLQPVLASRPGACPDDRGHRPGPGHRARGRAAARRLAAGMGYSGRWRAVPADAPAPGGRPAHAQPAAAGPRRHPRGSRHEHRTRSGRPGGAGALRPGVGGLRHPARVRIDPHRRGRPTRTGPRTRRTSTRPGRRRTAARPRSSTASWSRCRRTR